MRGARASGAGAGRRSWVSWLEVRAPPLTLRPSREQRGVPLSCRRAPRRRIAFPTGYSPPYCPASPWCRTERSVSRWGRPGQSAGRSRPAAGPSANSPPRPESGAAQTRGPRPATAPPTASEERQAPAFTRGSQGSPGDSCSLPPTQYDNLAQAAHFRLAWDCFAFFHS